MWRVFPVFGVLGVAYGSYLVFKDNTQLTAILGALAVMAILGFVVGKSLG
jgi:hypothetical protein